MLSAAYTSTITTDGTKRNGAYWKLSTDFKATTVTGTTAAPDGVGVDPGQIVIAEGVSGVADTSTRFNGIDHSCVQFTGFTAAEDGCLFDPASCKSADGTTTAMSMSIWVNLPNSFDTQKRVIVDTGGDENGGKGVQIYYVNSLDGETFSQQLTFVVSTGDKFWKVTVNGMLKSFEWNNIALRWSSDVQTADNLPYGLQVYVNKIQTGWRRGSVSTGITGATSATIATVGCDAGDFSHAMNGRAEHLAVWYAQLLGVLDLDGAVQNANNYFDNQVNYESQLTPCQNQSCLDTITIDNNGYLIYGDPSSVPWQYTNRTDLFVTEVKNLPDDDNSPATDGDCARMTCADTVNEMSNAAYANDKYTASDFLKAGVRTVNRAGSSGLSDGDVSKLLALFSSYGLTALNNQTLTTESDAAQLLDITQVVGKLSEGCYQDRWRAQHNNGDMGLTKWAYFSEVWVSMVVSMMSSSKGIMRDSNQTVIFAYKQLQTAIQNSFVFPDYNSPNVTFDYIRNATWGDVSDSINLTLYAFQGWQPTDIVYLWAKLYNSYDLSLPSKLSASVQGADASFSVNSRVVSLTLAPPMADPTFLTKYPLQYTLAHRSWQDDRPYRKGAVLCVNWEYADSDKIGSWYTGNCKLVMTNDSHTVCACSHTTDFALLMEDYTAPGIVADAGYVACEIFYGISIICLIIFIALVVSKSQLYYEIHFIHLNCAVALLFAIIFYWSSYSANGARVSCIVVSVFTHFFYTAAYAWFCLAAHYVFRAITSGRVTGIMLKYSVIGWALPGLIVAIMSGLKVDSYGIGVRCFATVYNYYMYVYIGSFLLFCALVFPLLCIALCNLNKNGVKNMPDWHDVKFGLIGISIVWPFIFLTWLMALFIYVAPQESQGFDFVFELFNSIQGILIFIFLGLFIPSFRDALMCRKPKEMDSNGEMVDRSKLFQTYYD